MDIDTLKLKYFNYFHKESNDITELYNFYKEFTNEYKSKTFRKPHNQNSDTTSSKNSSSAMKKQKEFNEIDKKSSLVSNEFEKNLAQHLKKICRTNTHELLQKNKLSISILNKDLFNQKLNFINIMPTTNHGKPPKCDNYFKNKIRNSKSMEKMLNKKEIISNVSLNSNCSLEKRKDTAHHEKHQTEIDKIICLNNKSNNIFSTLPIEKQQKILMNNSKITDIDKIRNITKIFKNYRCTKSEIPNGKIKMQEKIDLSKVNENKFINFIDSFFEKSGIESKSIKGEKFLGKTEEIDEKSFMEGLKQAANNNNFNGKDISNDPSFILHS